MLQEFLLFKHVDYTEVPDSLKELNLMPYWCTESYQSCHSAKWVATHNVLFYVPLWEAIRFMKCSSLSEVVLANFEKIFIVPLWKGSCPVQLGQFRKCSIIYSLYQWVSRCLQTLRSVHDDTFGWQSSPNFYQCFRIILIISENVCSMYSFL